MAGGGLGILSAAILLAGEMAGSGVLALPSAMVGTGGALGIVLIITFTLNSLYSGTRLGMCWLILEERYEEYRGQVRDPYPAIGERAIGRWGRIISMIAIALTLYGGCCVFIVLISQLLGSLVHEATGLQLTLCSWMVIAATGLTPLTWMGTPKDFWWIAVGALVSTMAACILVIINCIMKGITYEDKSFPSPTFHGSFEAFASIMFAYAGASTFPTIQADMKDRGKFIYSAIIAIMILFLIYFPVAVSCYYSLGSSVSDNIVLNMTEGWERVLVEIMLLIHLITTFPIILNPPTQIMEHVLKISADFNWKRCAFRTLTVFFLLFIAESIPSFGAILQLIGASTVTLLTFIFPPLFYMRLVDASTNNKEWIQRKLPVWERVYCWTLIVIGVAGGCIATFIAAKNILTSEMLAPCYIAPVNITNDAGSH